MINFEWLLADQQYLDRLLNSYAFRSSGGGEYSWSSFKVKSLEPFVKTYSGRAINGAAPVFIDRPISAKYHDAPFYFGVVKLQFSIVTTALAADANMDLIFQNMITSALESGERYRFRLLNGDPLHKQYNYESTIPVVFQRNILTPLVAGSNFDVDYVFTGLKFTLY